jgi:hypothetical protein
LIFLFCLVPFYLKFFEARFLNSSFLNVSSFLFCCIVIVVSAKKIFLKSRHFSLPVRTILCSTVFSMFMAYSIWNQSFFESLISTAPYMIWILFFFLMGNNIRIRDLELLAAVYGLIYAALYFYQYKNYGTVLFGYNDEYGCILYGSLYRA